MTDSEAYFRSSGGALIPTGLAVGWWTPGMVHGRLLAGLLAREVERGQVEPGLRVARLTVDLFRAAPMGPLRLAAERIRDGRRIRVADVTVCGEAGPVARASAVLLRAGEEPPGYVPATGPWDAPPPGRLPPPYQDGANGVQFWRFDEQHQSVRNWKGDQRRRAWIRETVPLVAGEELAPLVRAALAADTGSPLAHASDGGLRYINADFTMLLSRLPVGELIGLESTSHSSHDGIAVGSANLYDASGPIGYSATTAIANPPRD